MNKLHSHNIKALVRHLTFQLFAPGTLMRERYEAFRELLEHDRAANIMLARFEELFATGEPVDYNKLAAMYDKFSAEVFQMMETLFRMAPASYRNLRDYYRKMDFYIRFALVPSEMDDEPPFIIHLNRPCNNIALAGGKAGNLWQIIHKTGLHVPSAFVITIRAFNRFLNDNGLVPIINELLSEIEISSDHSIKKISERLQAAILEADMPPEVIANISDALSCHNEQNLSGSRKGFAVRSSALFEDSEYSFAGQYKTLLDIPASEVVSACLEVFASKYTPEALRYRIRAGYHDSETPMAVLVMEMAETEYSGVMYTVDPSKIETGSIVISSVQGPCRQVVDGTAEPGSCLVQRETLATDIRQGSSLVPDMKSVQTLADIGLKIEKMLGEPADVEWAIDGKGKISILQARPLKLAEPDHVDTHNQEPDISGEVLCKGGICASGGIASGRVVILKDMDQLYSVPNGSVVVARAALPALAGAVEKIAAVITTYGSAASHFASVAREMSIPFIAGNSDAAVVLKDGMEVTVHAARCTVFAGILTGDRKQPSSVPTSPSGRFEKTFRYILQFIAPLRLIDPDSSDFRPEGCRSLHDIIRFVHETALREMFHPSCRTASKREGAVKLISKVPMNVFVLNVSDGIAKETAPENEDSVKIEDIRSLPMRALWKGLSHPDISWLDFDHFDWKTYDSIVMAGGITSSKSAEFASYAIISRQYMNLNMRFGYHFTIIDSLCSEDEMLNYISLRFAGGGGDFHGRQLRLLFLKTILLENGFSVRHTGDLVDARLQNGDSASIQTCLETAGKLLGVTRLMDMSIQNEADVKAYIDNFMSGDYSFTVSMNR